MPEKYDTILVLDFGGQYCHLIGRRIRENSVYSEIVPYDITPEEVKALNEKFNVKGLILSGGPSSVYEPNAPKLRPANSRDESPDFRLMLWTPTYRTIKQGHRGACNMQRIWHCPSNS